MAARMAAMESLSSCAPQLNCQPAPPMAQAPTPSAVISRSLLPNFLVDGISIRCPDFRKRTKWDRFDFLRLPRKSSVFHARFDVRVRRLDQSSERAFIHLLTRSQLHMPHEPARANQQAIRIGQHSAMEEPDIYVRSENIDVAERRVSQAGDGTAVMQ